METKNSEINRLNGEISASQTGSDELTDQLRKTISESSAGIESLKSTNQTSVEKLEGVTSELKSTQEKLKTADCNVEEMTKELNATKIKLTTLESEISLKTDEISSSNEKFNVFKDEKAAEQKSFTVQIEDLKNMMAELQTHLDKRNEEFHNLTGSSQIEINELKSSLDSKVGC